MSKSKAISRPFEQTAYQRAELDALRRMLDLAEGTFSLSVAICNSPALRDHLIENSTSELENIEVVRIPEDAQDIFDFVRRQMPNEQPRAVFVADIEKALAGDKRDRVLQGLNVSREQWRSAYECPVVFWLADYTVELLSTRARDLWSWVSHHFEFVSEQATASAGLQDNYAGNITLAANLDVHEKHFRIAELEQRIADAEGEPEGQLREHVSIWRNELAYLYQSLGDIDRAMALLKEQERIARQLGNLNDLQTSLGNQALILKARGDLDGAMALLKEQERICRPLGKLNELQTSLGNQALILQDRGDLDGAMALLKEQERICRPLGNLDGLSRTLGNQAFILWAHGDLDGAMALLKEQERIARQLGSLSDLQTSLGNQAMILKARRDLDAAMALLKEVERICRQLSNVEGLAASLANQASVLREMGHIQEALPLAEQAHQLATGHGYAALGKQIEPMLGALRHATQEA
jgi:tetratricopeptide (TPR) repeat protein